ncbi:MAG: hypothetical protein ACI88A_000869 [Paraglaciecola sp.]|jgi:hypothetical protein
MLKNLLLAILIALLLTYSMGHIAAEWFDIRIHLDNEVIEPLTTMAAITVIGVLLIMIGFILAVSVFGVLLFAFIAVFAGLIIAGLSAVWPTLLLFVAIIWLVKDKPVTR